MLQQPEPAHVLQSWLEWDLSAAVAAGELAPVFQVHALVTRVKDVMRGNLDAFFEGWRRRAQAGPSSAPAGEPRAGEPPCSKT